MTTPLQEKTESHLVCPSCARRYAIGEEEYCEDDGERLETRLCPSAAQTPEQAQVKPQQSDVGVAPPTDEEKVQQDSDTEASTAPPDLESVLSKYGVRQRQAAQEETIDDSAAHVTGASAPITSSNPGPSSPKEAVPAADENPLPRQVREKGWEITGQAISTETADEWVVHRPSTAGAPVARFSRFRARVLTTAALYQRLQATPCAALPTLLDFGTANLRGNVRASFELSLLPTRQKLQSALDWLGLAPPSEAKALALLPHLVDMLSTLSNSGAYPISFQPAQLLRHQESGQILLDSFAALADLYIGATDYRPDLAMNGLISRLWSAPELSEQLVVSPKAAIFSVGQMLAFALWGQPLDLAALRTGNVPLTSISDTRLARVLQGCLWINSMEGRWDISQLQAAVDAPLDQLPAVEDWAQLGPRAMGQGYALAGRTFWRVEDLLAYAVQPQHWPHATAHISAMLDWIETSTWASLAIQLRAQLEAGRSADFVLIQLARSVIPSLPLTWRGLDFSDSQVRNSLIHLAQRNLAMDTKTEESELLDALFSADLRGAFRSTALTAV